MREFLYDEGLPETSGTLGAAFLLPLLCMGRCGNFLLEAFIENAKKTKWTYCVFLSIFKGTERFIILISIQQLAKCRKSIASIFKRDAGLNVSVFSAVPKIVFPISNLRLR